jgi:hypothetical protein
MTPSEATSLARRMRQSGRNPSGDDLQLSATVEGDQLSFLGGLWGPHGLSIRCSSPERAVIHWRGYVANSGLTPTTPAPKAPPPEVGFQRGDRVRFASASASAMGGFRIGEVLRVTPTRVLIGYRFKKQRGQGPLSETWQKQKDVRLVRRPSASAEVAS